MTTDSKPQLEKQFNDMEIVEKMLKVNWSSVLKMDAARFGTNSSYYSQALTLEKNNKLSLGQSLIHSVLIYLAVIAWSFVSTSFVYLFFVLSLVFLALSTVGFVRLKLSKRTVELQRKQLSENLDELIKAYPLQENSYHSYSKNPEGDYM